MALVSSLLDRLQAGLGRIGTGIESLALARPRVTLSAGFIIAFLCGLGLLRIEFANDYKVFFAPDDPQRMAQEALERDYTTGDTLILMIEARDDDLFTPQRLATINKAHDVMARLPHVVRTESIISYQGSRSGPDGLIVEPLIPAGAVDPKAVRVQALSDEAVTGRLISADGRAAQIIATIALPAHDPGALITLADAAYGLRDQLRADHGDLRFSASGVVLLSHAFYDITQDDLMRLVPLMSLILLVAIALFFRSLAAAFAAMLTLGLSVVTTLGLCGWLGFSLSPASGQTPIIILTIATAEAIHLIALMTALRGAGEAGPLAARATLRANHLPIFITALTDIMGFMAFNFSDTPPFRDLGSMASIGVIVAYLFSVMFLPALLVVLPLRADTRFNDRQVHFEKVARVCIAHRGKVLASFACLVAVSALMLPRLEVRDNFLDWLAPGQAFRVDAENANRAMPSLYTMQFSLPSPRGVSDPAYLRDLDRFVGWLRLQPEVHHVWSLAALMKRLNRNMHEDDPGASVLPENAETAAQYLLLYEMSLTDSADLTSLVTLDKMASRIVVSLDDVSSEAMMDLKRRAEQWLAREAPVMVAPATGTSLMFATLTEENSRSMAGGTLAAFMMIAVAIGIALRSARLGLASLLPSMVPAVMAFGLWYLLEGHIGLYAAFVVSCALGLVIDATTHFLLVYSGEARALGRYGNDAVIDSFRHIGMDLWVASIVLMLGFGILCLSQFAIIASLAKMVVLIFIFGTASTFLLLPALLSLIDQPRLTARSASSRAAIAQE
jgi:uncharacterized protein